MASTARAFGRTTSRFLSSSTTSSLRTATAHNTQRAAAQNFSRSSRRTYSTANAASHIKSNLPSYTTITLLSALSGVAVYYITTQTFPSAPSLPIPESLISSTSKAASTTTTSSTTTAADPKPFIPTFADYQKIYDAIATKLWDSTDYDDGSYAPVILRLAWHSSGTYDKTTNTGGSNGGLMRFRSAGSESTHGANAGLINAREFLQPIKDDPQFSWISYGDFWTLAGVVAIQEMQGPKIPWRPGRRDWGVERSAPEGRLPDGSRTQGDYVREVFRRMGFESDQEFVALSGAHAVGRCHVKNSGFEGPWTYSPTVLTNEYFRLLVEEQWDVRGEEDKEWVARGGKRQYKDRTTGGLMMLPTDMALVKDEGLRVWVERYARDGDLFFNDFRDVVVKLFELGVPFEQEERFTFKSTLDDE